MKYFDQPHRIGADECNKGADLLQSEKIYDYNSFNFYKTNTDDCDKSVDKMQEFAANNFMNIKEGYGYTNSCRVDNDSDLRFKTSMSTNTKEKTQLFSRTFQGVPNLFKGTLKADEESKIIQGVYSGNEKSCRQTSEKPYDTFVPMINCLKDNIQNPNNIIPSWQWGGEGTRDTVQQKTFLEKNGYVKEGTNWSKKQCRF